MAGHSKWANIKFRKAAQDARRGKLFTKLIREITVSARSGGGDVAANSRLRAAVDKALAANMTRDTIDRAVKRGTGELDGVDYEEIRYEGYGPGGAAILVECTTDNRNRTVGEVRHAFTKNGGSLAAEGSVANFSGYVLRANDGRQVFTLEFEHYPGMTEQSIKTIIDESADRWPLLAASVVHRVGRLSPGDQIVWVGVASTHREAAFNACEFIMDYLKTDAVFWKRELTENSEQWVQSTRGDISRAKTWSEEAEDV